MDLERNKNEIISTIRRANVGITSDNESIDMSYPVPAFDDQVQKFREMLELVGGEIRCLEAGDDLNEILSEVLDEFKGKTVLVPDDPDLRDHGITELLNKCNCKVLIPDQVKVDDAARADLGITTAIAGIADTGTVILHHTAEKGRLAALLPPVHLVLLKREDIALHKQDFVQTIGREGGNLGEIPMSWVTGPSSTADIEKVLVRGAHGPRRLLVVIC